MSLETTVTSTCMDFSDALRAVKDGKKIQRYGWNGKNMFVVYQKGYPDGIPCNKQTAEAWGINEGDNFVCNPYLQIRCVDGSHSMWVPSINDLLADDWVICDIDKEEHEEEVLEEVLNEEEVKEEKEINIDWTIIRTMNDTLLPFLSAIEKIDKLGKHVILIRKDWVVNHKFVYVRLKDNVDIPVGVHLKDIYALNMNRGDFGLSGILQFYNSNHQPIDWCLELKDVTSTDWFFTYC